MSAAGTLPTDLPITAAQPVAAEKVFVRLLGASKKPGPQTTMSLALFQFCYAAAKIRPAGVPGG